jgi:malonate-semialdehyde dehydrogenase (acetylating) / methylmalonate-semialdehyde dehydrogenase
VIRRSYNTKNVEPTVKMFIDGKFVESKTNDWVDLHDPATNEIVTRVPKCTQDEMQAAVDSSKRAFKTWSQTSILTRQQVMLKLQAIMRANMDELARNIVREQGKTLVDAEGDVLRGIREFKEL